MAKFNNTVTNKTTNREGHVAYSMQDKSKLITQVLTSFFNESKFYGDNSKEMCDTIKNVIRDDPAFVSNLAVFARREFNMRSVAHVLTGYLANVPEGKPFVRQTVEGVVLRGDDATEILSFYLSTFGKPIPNSLRRALKGVFATFDAYTLAKYKGEGHAVKMRDLLRICRPHPETDEQSAMWKQLLDDTLPTPLTWESELSANGNTKESWEKLIESGKVGYMALLRNLRNIVNACPENIGKVWDKIADPEAVRRSRQLPFRFLSAYKNLPSGCGSKAVNSLESAADAACENLPRLPGKTVIAVDVSGSMGSNVSSKSEIRCCEIGMMLGLIANKICDDAVFYEFDNRIEERAISNRQGILYTCVHEAKARGGTDMRLPFHKMLQDKVKADRIIFISDNECNYGIRAMQSYADQYRRELNPDCWVHAIDLMGYGTQQFCGKNTNVIAGWSEKVFDFILLAEQGEGTLEKRIEEYEWKHEARVS